MRTNRALFRAMDRIEENMLRAAMPKVSAKDAVGLRPIVTFAARRPASSKTLTFKLSEVK